MKGDNFARHEVDSIYVDGSDRFVVSLIVGYGSTVDEDGVETAETAANLALDLTRDGDAQGTIWFVYDRKTGRMHRFRQSQFDEEAIARTVLANRPTGGRDG